MVAGPDAVDRLPEEPGVDVEGGAAMVAAACVQLVGHARTASRSAPPDRSMTALAGVILRSQRVFLIVRTSIIPLLERCTQAQAMDSWSVNACPQDGAARDRSGPRLPWPGWRCSDPEWQAAGHALDDPMGKAAGDSSAAGGRGAPPQAPAAGRPDVTAEGWHAFFLVHLPRGGANILGRPYFLLLAARDPNHHWRRMEICSRDRPTARD